MQLEFSCFSKLSTVLIFFSLVYSLKLLSSEIHLPILLISRREYRSITVCSMNLAKIYTGHKYTKKNCCRKVADKFDRRPEDAEKKLRTFAFFFSVITAIIWKPVDC